MAEETLSEKILYTLKGCPACANIEEELDADIKSGLIEIKECDLNSKNIRKLKNCVEAKNQHDFDGFPSMYDKSTGEKVI